MDKSTGTPSLEEKKALPNCGNKDGNIIHVLKTVISTSVATVLKCMNDCTHMYKSFVFGDEFHGDIRIKLQPHQKTQRCYYNKKLKNKDVLVHA